MRTTIQLAIAAGIGFFSVIMFGLPGNDSSTFAIAAQGCNIKGNISTRGERIYHVPGQKYYDETRISASHGERWFCSEQDARAAGWRKSKV